jgi:hypothetical protein
MNPLDEREMRICAGVDRERFNEEIQIALRSFNGAITQFVASRLRSYHCFHCAV